MRLVSATSLGRFKGPIKGKVSIIITNYKKERFLRKAILSCLRQSYKDIEVIVVDDCSDRAKSLAVAKGAGSDKVRYIYTSRNYGHYACCNYAIDKAKGKYITFLGADDILKKDHIKNLLTGLIQHKLVAICSHYIRLDEGGNKVDMGGKDSKLCEASILFDKNRFIRDIGYFHMARCAADSEYRLRAIKYYGKGSIGILAAVSYEALSLPDSLTRAEKTKGGSPARKSYVKQFNKNLKKSKLVDLYFDYKAGSAKFSMPKEVRVDNFDPKTFCEITL